MELAVKLGAVVLYMLILLAIGAVASRRMKNVGDYFAGGKQFGFWAASFSARATGESAWLLIGLTGMGAALGAKAFWVVLGETLGVSISWLLMCRPFKRLTDRYDSITVPDYLESRFGDKSHLLRAVAALSLVVFVTIYVSAQIDATGRAFEEFLQIDYYAGALLGFGVVLVYILSGGFVAVVWSDVFQGTLMAFGLVFLPIVGVIHAGGVAPITDNLHAIDPGLLTLAGPGGWSFEGALSAVGLALIGLGFLGSPQIFVRYLSMRSDKEVRPGSVVAIVWTVLAGIGAVLTGMVGRGLLTQPGADPEAILGKNQEGVLPALVEASLPLVLVGLFIAIVLSAIMSTVDSLLVLAGSAAVRDYYQRVKNPEMKDEALIPMSRKATLGLAVAALVVSMTVAVLSPERTVFWFVIFGWSGIAATFCPTMILSLAWRGFTTRGAIAAMVSGFLSVPLFKFVVPEIPGIGPVVVALSELPPAFIVSALVGVGVSLSQPLEVADQDRVDDDLAFSRRTD